MNTEKPVEEINNFQRRSPDKMVDLLGTDKLSLKNIRELHNKLAKNNLTAPTRQADKSEYSGTSPNESRVSTFKRPRVKGLNTDRGDEVESVVENQEANPAQTRQVPATYNPPKKKNKGGYNPHKDQVRHQHNQDDDISSGEEAALKSPYKPLKQINKNPDEFKSFNMNAVTVYTKGKKDKLKETHYKPKVVNIEPSEQEGEVDQPDQPDQANLPDQNTVKSKKNKGNNKPHQQRAHSEAPNNRAGIPI